MADKVRPEDLTLHPTTRSGRYASLSGVDIAYVSTVGATLYFGSDLLPDVFNGWVLILGGAAFMASLIRVGRFNKRVYRLPAYFIRNFKRRKLQHNRRWTQPGQPDPNERRKGGSEQSDLPIRAVRFGKLGTAVNESARMITFAVRIHGTDITTKTIAEQKTFNERLSEALKFSVAAVRRQSPYIGMVYRSRPDNEYEYERMLRSLVDDRVLLPPAEEKPEIEWDEDDYINSVLHQVVVQEGMEEIQSLVNPEMVFTFTVRYSRHFAKVLKAAQKKGGNKNTVEFDHKHLLKEPVMLLHNAVMPLFADVFTGGIKALDFDEMVMYLRMAHDLNISKYYLDTYLAENRGESLPGTSWMPEGKIDEYHDKVDVNGTWSASFYMTSFPDEFAFPFTAREFYTPRTTYYTAATIGKITRGNHRYRLVQGASDMSDGAKDFFGIDKRGPKAHKQQQQVYNNLAQLDRSGFAATYLPVLTVSKTSEYDLEVAAAHVSSRLDGSLFSPQRVIGESEQWEEFFSASTGIPLRF